MRYVWCISKGETQMATVLTTKMEGTDYVVRLIDGGAVWVRMIRVNADGTKEEAFLSNRQWRKEAAVKARFAKEIAEHRKGV